MQLGAVPTATASRRGPVQTDDSYSGAIYSQDKRRRAHANHRWALQHIWASADIRATFQNSLRTKRESEVDRSGETSKGK